MGRYHDLRPMFENDDEKKCILFVGNLVFVIVKRRIIHSFSVFNVKKIRNPVPRVWRIFGLIALWNVGFV